MKYNYLVKLFAILVVPLPILVACSAQAEQEQAQIEVLLPGLEFRSGVGFSPEKARIGLDATLESANKIFKDEDSLTAITFDSVSAVSAKVAAVPPGDIVTTYGDIIPVVALEGEEGVLMASAYADNGICFFLEMKAPTTSDSTLEYRKGVDFSITCNPFDYSDTITWSETSSWPSEADVTMPNSPNPVEIGTPAE